MRSYLHTLVAAESARCVSIQVPLLEPRPVSRITVGDPVPRHSSHTEASPTAKWPRTTPGSRTTSVAGEAAAAIEGATVAATEAPVVVAGLPGVDGPPQPATRAARRTAIARRITSR